jgi:hypothetical protein
VNDLSQPGFGGAGNRARGRDFGVMRGRAQPLTITNWRDYLDPIAVFEGSGGRLAPDLVTPMEQEFLPPSV